jgi:hypothetical protein
MGIIEKGITGGFSGKVGPVVGANWKGITYMRALPLEVKDPRTEAQLMHRSKFALVIFLLKPMTDFLRTGWKLYAQRKSPFNAAMSYTFAHAVRGEYPNYEIDAGRVLVSHGTLTPALNGRACVGEDGLVLSWDDNSGVGSAKGSDKALVMVVNPAKGEVVSRTAGAERSAGKQSISLFESWLGDEVLIYLGFISEDGRAVADSVYLGEVDV